MKKQYSKKQGFTLVELIISMTIFLILMVAVIGIFVSSIKAQRYYLASQKLTDQVSYVMEYMSRTIRMAKRQEADLGINCIDEGFNYQDTGGFQTGIKFVRVKDGNLVCQEFYLDGGQIKQTITDDVGISTTSILTSDAIHSNYLKFRLSGENKGCLDNGTGPAPGGWDWTDQAGCQPRVTIYLDAEVKGIDPAPQIEIQTSVSQRDLDIDI